jgi:hypothetical protein
MKEDRKQKNKNREKIIIKELSEYESEEIDKKDINIKLIKSIHNF